MSINSLFIEKGGGNVSGRSPFARTKKAWPDGQARAGLLTYIELFWRTLMIYIYLVYR
jgi:hypothetical protein